MADALGDRMKSYEAAANGPRAFPGQPLVVRIDGSAFSSLTSGLRRPWDARLTRTMDNVMADVARRLGAVVGYSQSDEINLVFWTPCGPGAEYPLSGRFQKLASLSASLAAASFARRAADEEGLVADLRDPAFFDARAFVVPTLQEAYHVLLWRQQDAVKNSVSSLARAHFPHARLQGLSGPMMQELLHQEKGVNWNDVPARDKRGAFCRRFPIDRVAPDGTVLRRAEWRLFDCWLSKEENPLKTLFEEAPAESVAKETDA